MIQPNNELIQNINRNQAWHYGIIPLSMDDSTISLFIDEAKFAIDTSNELEFILGKKIKLIPTPSDQILSFLKQYYAKSENEARAAKHLNDYSTENFLPLLINEAHNNGSSDIHIEPDELEARVRFRIDGKLVERYILNIKDYPALVNKVKIKARLDIAEKRLPQDGRILFSGDDSSFDIRVSILPTLHGEKIVLRLLSRTATELDIEKLGLSLPQLKTYLEGVKRTSGIILISGPTGSGKTTTLYATLKILNRRETNILTIEDPIEYTLKGINQVQLRENIGLTFAKALRTFLRQDPDIIMLGEIRDPETAQMAIRAALTGHLVLSTVHTNSAWGTISRLIDMGVPSYLLAGTLNLSVAQRLVRLLCPDCRTQVPYEPGMVPEVYKPDHMIDSVFTPKGCKNCYFTGYKGRKGIYEVIGIDSEITTWIRNQQFDKESELRNKGVRSLARQAFDLLSDGLTSVEEVYPILMLG
jgi:type IV pilus assembly protein PilB